MSHHRKVLVTGAGGFICHHLITLLKHQGYWMPGVHLKRTEFNLADADEFPLLDLRRWRIACRLHAVWMTPMLSLLIWVVWGSSHHAQILDNLHSLEAASENGVERYLYTSSAYVYPEYKQTEVSKPCGPES